MLSQTLFLHLYQCSDLRVDECHHKDYLRISGCFAYLPKSRTQLKLVLMAAEKELASSVWNGLFYMEGSAPFLQVLYLGYRSKPSLQL